MFNIMWLSSTGLNQVSGDMRSILSIANLLESNKLQFKVSDGFNKLNQSDLSHCGFIYWLNKEVTFGGVK